MQPQKPHLRGENGKFVQVIVMHECVKTCIPFLPSSYPDLARLGGTKQAWPAGDQVIAFLVDACPNPNLASFWQLNNTVTGRCYLSQQRKTVRKGPKAARSLEQVSDAPGLA